MVLSLCTFLLLDATVMVLNLCSFLLLVATVVVLWANVLFFFSFQMPPLWFYGLLVLMAHVIKINIAKVNPGM